MSTSPEEIINGSCKIKEAIEYSLNNNRPLLISRHGSFEFQCVTWKKNINYPLNDAMMAILHKNVGIFPRELKSMEEWLELYWQSSCESDGIATGWYLPIALDEKKLVEKYNSSAFQFPLRSLESYYVEPENRWTSLFADRRVTVVSSFAKTMEEQVLKAKDIWNADADSLLPPTTKWSFIRSYYPPDITLKSTAWPFGIKSWKDAVNYIVENVEKTNPEIVLIGCGGLALPAAAELKKRGCIVIVMGGAIQVLFGIKGGRWKNHAIISQFWNNHWVYPKSDETPSHAGSVENKCYW